MCYLIVDYDTNALRKKVNEVQKEISAKKKVSIDLIVTQVTDDGFDIRQNNLQMTLLQRRKR